MTREASERRLIAQLSAAMAAKLALPRNRAKGGWERMEPGDLIIKLSDELRELVEALIGADFDDPICVARIEKECADVGAFAGMILDNARNHWGKR